MTEHLKLLYINVHTDGCPISRVIVDNQTTGNILPYRMLRKLEKMEENLITSKVTVSNFIGGLTTTRGVIPIELQVGLSAFFVVHARAQYKAKLRRDWIHSDWCITPLHRCPNVEAYYYTEV